MKSDRARFLTDVRRAVSEGRVVLYRVEGTEIYCVLSKLRDKLYIVIPGSFCSCYDFFFSIYLGKRRGNCYHLESVKLALEERKIRVIDVSKEEFRRNILPKILLGMLL